MASSPSTSIRRVRPAELARELKVSRQAIHDLIARNVIAKDADGLIDADMARVALATRVRPSGKTAAAAAGQPAPLPGLPPPVAPPADQHMDPAAATSYHVARTLRETEEARMAKMKRQQLEGSLIERDPAVSATFTAFRQLRDAVMPVGRSVAARLVPLTDAREIQLEIEAEIRAALTNFSEKTLARLAQTLNGAPAPTPPDLTADTAEKATT